MNSKNPTVMVIEDESLLLQAITQKLKLNKIEVLACSSGQQAFESLKSIDQLPDVIWLDYYLKDTNGLAFMQELRKNEKWAAIPVIVVSNSASPEKVEMMKKLGVKNYILKAEHRLDDIIIIIYNLISGSPPLQP